MYGTGVDRECFLSATQRRRNVLFIGVLPDQVRIRNGFGCSCRHRLPRMHAILAYACIYVKSGGSVARTTKSLARPREPDEALARRSHLKPQVFDFCLGTA